MTNFIPPKHKTVFGLTLAILILVGATFWVGLTSPERNQDEAPAGWLTYTDGEVSFRYPETLGTTYMHPYGDWPPKVQIVNEAFVCTEAGVTTVRAGETKKKMIGGREFCVTSFIGAAAGSTYEQYAYATPLGSKTAIFTFTIQSPQCGNYDEVQKIECEKERETFNLDETIALITSSLNVGEPNTVAITNFKECEAAGYPIMESYPRQCRTAAGRLFVEEIRPTGELLGTLAGVVKVGPTCPVEREPPDPNCADRPYSGAFKVVRADSGALVKNFISDIEGRYSVSLPSGQYIIKHDSTGRFPACGDVGPVTVRPNLATEANINCDSGIR